MPKKKKDNKESSEEERLNKKVDAMLDPKLPDPQVPKANDAPPLDIFKEAPDEVTKATKSAPEVSGKLLEKVDAKEIVSEPAPHTIIDSKKPDPKPRPVPQDVPRDPINKDDPLEDEETDKAVTDIATKEGNTLLELQDALGKKASRVAGSMAKQDQKKARRRHWFWLIFIAAFVSLVLLALPFNPYTCDWPVGIRLRVTTDILPSVCR